MNYTIVGYMIFNLMVMFSYDRCMRIFFEKRKTSKQAIIFSYLVYYISSGIAFLLFNLPIICLLVTFCSFYVISLNYESIMRKRFIAVVCCILCFLTIYLFVVIVSTENVFALFVSGKSLNFSIYIFIIAGALVYSASLLLNKFKNIRKNTIISPAFFASFITVQAFSVLMLFWVLVYLPHSMRIIVVGLVLAKNIFTFYFYDNFSNANMQNTKTKLLEEEKAYFLFQFQHMQESEEKIQSISHDMKKHLIVLKSFSEGNREAVHYINRLLDDIGESESYSDTGNIAVDSLINYKFRNARKDNVNLNINICIPKNLDMEMVDIAMILGNILDNAINAVAKVENKIIELDISFCKTFLFIKIKNTFDGNVENRFESTKKEEYVTELSGKREYGYGLKNVSKVVQKYNGHMKIDTNEEMFSVGILLSLAN